MPTWQRKTAAELMDAVSSWGSAYLVRFSMPNEGLVRGYERTTAEQLEFTLVNAATLYGYLCRNSRGS
jgi:hypothetical protein